MNYSFVLAQQQMKGRLDATQHLTATVHIAQR
jgi:hypothetical protein